MVTEPSSPASTTPFAQAALAEADRKLASTSHADLTLREIAAAAGGTHPAILKQFDSQLGFLAALAARQWQRATARLDRTDGSPMALAMADIEFAIDNPHRFRLMYDHQLWSAVNAKDDQNRPRERARLKELEAVRNKNYGHFHAAMGGKSDDLRPRLVGALLTGLSFEFVNEKLCEDDRDEQLQHARELLGMMSPLIETA